MSPAIHRALSRLKAWPEAVWVGFAILLCHSLVHFQFSPPSAFRKYGLAAEQLLRGELSAERQMDFSPLYFELSLFAKRFLPLSEELLLALQLVLVAIAGAWLYTLLRQRFGRGLALAAIATLTMDRHLLVYVQILEPEACLLFFLLGCLYCCETAWPELLRGTARHGFWSTGAGVFAGLGLATRPNLLPVFLLVPFYFWLRGARGRALGSAAASFLSPLLLTLALLLARAHALTGDPWTPMMNPGTVFFEGNNPLSHGTSAVYPPVVLAYVQRGGEIPDGAHEYYRFVARASLREQLGREATISEVNLFWADRGMAGLRQDPGRGFHLLLEKLVRACHNFRWHDVPTAWRYDQMIFLPSVPFALVAALALCGLLLEVSRWREALLYYAVFLAQLGVMVVFYVSARQRLPLLPALLYFAAVTVERGLRQKRPRAERLGLLALVLLLTGSLLLPNDLTHDERYRRQGHLATDLALEGLAALEHEDEPISVHNQLLLTAITASPWWLEWIRPAGFPQEEASLEAQLLARLDPALRTPSAQFDRAILALKAGQDAMAETLLQELAAEGIEFYRNAFAASEPLFFLSRVAARRGDHPKAIALLRQALERSPGNPFILAELIALTDDPVWQPPLLAAFSPLDAQLLLGQALLFHGRNLEAVRAFTFLVRRLPDFRLAHMLLAAALARSQRDEEAVFAYREALRFGPEPVHESAIFVELFTRWAAAHRDQPEAQLLAAQALHQHGRLHQALALLDALTPPSHLESAVVREQERLRKALGLTP